ncbi:CASP-like protein 2C1 [Eucalyptus grandis]|uniref:CASP-like protein n=3 Tax=Eucalyptus grandis TaxID=71139 RepID=A0A059CJU0_EUCGR|nr:CASP-like protein 2C1 [Eucalyptus grandis]KAK3435475.1 hypothetical protein EUGRSUZ_C00172 [Eucalyptus grandis]KAK3435476.1 hypothetical protein EUGRSUZ_C00172 [Eucalyptus grandis]
MGYWAAETEVFLRVCAILLLVLTACLVAMATQTKLIMYTYARKATFRDLNALPVLVYIDGVVAGYNLLQLSRCSVSAYCKREIQCPLLKNLSWVHFLLDQVAVYTVFATTVAATQASLLAVTGSKAMQWMKLCNRYTRFCIQVGGALLCGYAASIVLVLMSFLSVYNLFRRYSPTKFLQLKSKQ